MPIIEQSSYKANWIYRDPHLSTILPAFRKEAKLQYQRHRFQTPDDDFFDVDFSKLSGSRSLGILCHGLEGSSHSPYMTHAAKTLNDIGIDAAGFNYRSCSGEPNNLIRSYHSGKSDDLAFLISHMIKEYESIYLIGFSIGGNITLKYLGENLGKVPEQVKRAIVYAVPFCLEACAYELTKPHNSLYMKVFLWQLHDKVKAKMKKFPGQIDDEHFHKIKTFYDYDRLYTAPLNGFKDEYDYWNQASSKRFLTEIDKPTVIINAQDDPFLAGECYPLEAAKTNPNLFLEMPKYGGHMGFARFAAVHWWQERMMEIITSDQLAVGRAPAA